MVLAPEAPPRAAGHVPAPDRRGSDIRRLAAPALSAVLLAAASPPLDLGWLGWVALAPAAAALLGTAAGGSRRYSGPGAQGFVLGFCFLLLLAPWFAAFSPAGYPVGAAYWGLLTAGFAAGVMGLAAGLPPAWAPPLLAAGWTVHEWVRTQGTLTFPWGQLAATQHSYLPVLQMLDLTGSFGLSFLMALTGVSLGALAVPAFRGPARHWLGLCAAVSLALAARGAWLLASPPSPGETARVAVVQASESRQEPGARVVCISRPEEYASWSLQAARQGADLVVWPESAAVDDLLHDPRAAAWAGALVRQMRASLVAGSFVTDPVTGRSSNSAVSLSPGGEVLGRYDKVFIVPFGEYLPARPLLRWTERLGMPAEDLVAGREFRPLQWSRSLVGVSICYESAFSAPARIAVARGADMLAILTSDGWAGRTAVGYQHRAFAPLRAVENRRSVARAAATGVSELIDPYGRRLRSLPMFTRGTVSAELPLRHDRTLYSYVGDWPVAFSLLLLCAGAAARLRRRGRGIRDGAADQGGRGPGGDGR